MSESERARAEHNVTQGRQIVAEQREIISRLKSLGRDTYEAQKELDLFEDSLSIFETPCRNRSFLRSEEADTPTVINAD